MLTSRTWYLINCHSAPVKVSDLEMCTLPHLYYNFFLVQSEAVVCRCSSKWVFLKNFANFKAEHLTTINYLNM